MNDFDYDVKEKKRIARGAFAKKNGSKSKKCTLPGDFLTAAEKAKLSTTLVDVNLKKPMTWEQFKALPTDIKREYLTHLVEEYNATQAWVSGMMQAPSLKAWKMYLANHEPTLTGIFPKGRRYETDEMREKWNEFLKSGSCSAPKEEKKERFFVTYTPAFKAADELDEKVAELDDSVDEWEETVDDSAEKTADILELPFSEYKPLPIEMDFTFGCVTAEQLCDFIKEQMRDSICFTAKLTLSY